MKVIYPPKSGDEARRRRWQFPAWIEQECRDPGTRNALRKDARGQSAETADRLDRCIAPWLPNNCPPQEQAVYYTLAMMIADRPRHEFSDPDDEVDEQQTPTQDGSTGLGPGSEGTESAPADSSDSLAGDRQPGAPVRNPGRGESLGAAYARAVISHNMRESTARDRLKLLARQTPTGVHKTLPRAVRHLRNHGVRPHWPRLFEELAVWPRSRDDICRRWRQDFYQLLNDNALAEAEREDRAEVETP
ncbi:type I-E CRISPR-associated protein Cse2/CasB [Streptomyces sp. ST2-7A]|uniref:type I-E CRISPR-associated protein Cse2/CasB n=1 Tax=Streptomyces sp. ST2-7A TaxID=2907214 RepID=UPI001F377A49|nr:type I-E CRISPR-associated protein Cse2/CasB [Streptomyces sp. ST2-7A]MCE7081675.1 type I-E CRISPR-associated protein Cse2/CasB [Streptomyces sp. ST2-7A]